MRQACTLTVLVALFMGAVSGCAMGSGGTAGSGSEGGPSAQATSSVETIESGGVIRSYRLYRPGNLPSGPVPLLIGLHGGGGSPQQFEEGSGFDALADEDGFITAYPAAQGGIWHVGCCEAPLSSPDDLEFIEAMIDHLVASADVDPSRVYVTGFSVGATMAFRMGCESPKITGIAPVEGWEVLSVPCQPVHPLTLFEIHGTKDSYYGSCGEGSASNEECPEGFGTKGYSPSVQQVNEQWREANECPAAAPATRTFGVVTEQTWEPCASGSAVRLDTIENGGHCWPTATSCGDFDASEAIWSFLSSHSPMLEEAPGEEAPEEDTGGEETGTHLDALPSAPTSRPVARPGSAAPERKPRCHVPDLKGRTLTAARRVAHRRRCGLGPVRLSRSLRRRKRSIAHWHLVVRWQSVPAGAVRPLRSRISVIVGASGRS